MNSPLVTKEYFFPIVQVVAEPNFPDDADINDVPYEISTGLVKGKKKGTYQLTLEIKSVHKPDEKKHLNAYKIHLVVIGYFEVSPKWPAPEKLIEINGASILFSAAREYLITITSRGPWGALMLPTISFNNSSKENGDKTEKPNKKKTS